MANPLASKRRRRAVDNIASSQDSKDAIYWQSLGVDPNMAEQIAQKAQQFDNVPEWWRVSVMNQALNRQPVGSTSRTAPIDYSQQGASPGPGQESSGSESYSVRVETRKPGKMAPHQRRDTWLPDNYGDDKLSKAIDAIWEDEEL